MKTHNHVKAQKFDEHSFTTNDGNELPQCEVLTCGNMYDNVSSDTTLPKFSVIYFDAMPEHCCVSLVLQNYVASHIGSEDSKNLEDLTSMSTKIHDLKNKILELNKIPMQIDAWSLQGVFYLLNKSSWKPNGYCMVMKQHVGKTSDALISSMHPHGNENIRHRAS